MTQTTLAGFSDKTISSDEYGKHFRPCNRLVYDWEVKYQGYRRREDDTGAGYINFHLIARIVETAVTVRAKNTYKKVKKPGYKLVVTQNLALPGHGQESFIVYEEAFQKEHLKKAFDAFQREVLNIQSWITIAESRAKLIPQGKDVFECPFCGWVTDKWQDDITCEGCGKRFWSENLWRRALELQQNLSTLK